MSRKRRARAIALLDEYLTLRGWHVVDRSWTAPQGGELDLVAIAPDGVLVAVDVTLLEARYGAPSPHGRLTDADSMTPRRSSMLRALTTQWLREREGSFAAVRIDEAAVTKLRDGGTVIEYRVDAA